MNYSRNLLVFSPRSYWVRGSFVLLVVSGLLLSMLLHPSVVKAADYTISDEASCTAFNDAFNTTGSYNNGVCFIGDVAFPKDDLLTTNIPITIYDFINYGTIQANKGIDFGASVNFGTITLMDYSTVHGGLINEGTILVYDELAIVGGDIYNMATIRVFCGGSITGGTVTGFPVEYEVCPTITPTVTNTPLPGCEPSGGQPKKCTPTPTKTPQPTKTPKR